MKKTTEQYLYTALLAIIILTLVVAVNAYAKGQEPPLLLGAQCTLVAQQRFPLAAAYSEPKSLRDDGDSGGNSAEYRILIQRGGLKHGVITMPEGNHNEI